MCRNITTIRGIVSMVTSPLASKVFVLSRNPAESKLNNLMLNLSKMKTIFSSLHPERCSTALRSSSKSAAVYLRCTCCQGRQTLAQIHDHTHTTSTCTVRGCECTVLNCIEQTCRLNSCHYMHKIQLANSTQWVIITRVNTVETIYITTPSPEAVCPAVTVPWSDILRVHWSMQQSERGWSCPHHLLQWVSADDSTHNKGHAKVKTIQRHTTKSIKIRVKSNIES